MRTIQLRERTKTSGSTIFLHYPYITGVVIPATDLSANPVTRGYGLKCARHPLHGTRRPSLLEMRRFRVLRSLCGVVLELCRVTVSLTFD